jgi:hypothetical protein
MIAGSVRIALPASSPRSAAFLRTAASWASVLACLKLNPTTPGLVMGMKRSTGDLVWVVMMLPNGSAHPIPETYAGRRKKSSATFHRRPTGTLLQPRRFICFHRHSHIQRLSTRSLPAVCATHAADTLAPAGATPFYQNAQKSRCPMFRGMAWRRAEWRQEDPRQPTHHDRRRLQHGGNSESVRKNKG